MERREALRLLAAATLAPGFLRWEPDAFIDGLRGHLGRDGPAAPPAGGHRFLALDEHQRATVDEISEMIIPATDTPGAKAVHVDEFVDVILSEWCSDAERADFLAGLAALDAASMQQYQVAFLDASPDQRAALLSALDAELSIARAARKAWKQGNGPRPRDHTKMFWHQMRSLTVTGYYTSETGYTVERHEVLIPGIWKACTPLEMR
jgi:hypothetical protein